jgi:Golgi nucleoside diphosphatase
VIRSRQIFLLIISLLSTSQALAAQNQDVLVVDAGSSHSELFLFHMTPKANTLPDISVTYHSESDLALSEQVANPAGVRQWVLELTKSLPPQLVPTTPIYVMGTAGMRQLSPEQQQDVYQAVTAELENQTHFQPKFVGTIDGQQEGIFGWLTVNYLSNRLANPKATTYGVLDMGGGSTEITFETHTTARPEDLKPIHLGSYHYQVFSHSFLGLGHNEALKRAGNPSCYPTNTPLSDGTFAQFNYETCLASTAQMLHQDEVADIVPSVSQKTFVGLSGYYYTFDFFNSISSPKKLKTKVQQFCQQPWDNIKLSHPTIADKYLKTYCFTGIYDAAILTDGYHQLLQNNTVKVLDKINDVDLDWTLGAALFYYMQ